MTTPGQEARPFTQADVDRAIAEQRREVEVEHESLVAKAVQLEQLQRRATLRKERDAANARVDAAPLC